jgi:hypothetical protein
MNHRVAWLLLALLFVGCASQPSVRVARPRPELPLPGPPSPSAQERLESGDIMRTILGARDPIAACAKSHREQEGSVGKIVMKWRVLTDGSVRDVEIVTGEFASSVMGACLTDLLYGLRFPEHRQPTEPVQFPFKF